MPELDFIRWLIANQKPDARVPIPIGDDLAAMKWTAADLLLVGIDQVLDGVHFDSTIHAPRAIGRKAMNRNLSDCAAMACLPAAALVSLALPAGCGENYAKDLHAGLADAGANFDCPIIGGDTGSWPGKLAVTVTILGRSDGISPITRTGAKPGDTLYVTGPLGGSIRGRHMTFEPRVQLARDLATRFRIHAMMDLSDGLAADLPKLCEMSRVGAQVQLDRLPIHADVPAGTAAIRQRCAFSDGEDYELLIASPDELPEPCVAIGLMSDRLRIELMIGDAIVDFPTAGIGWEHDL